MKNDSVYCDFLNNKYKCNYLNCYFYLIIDTIITVMFTSFIMIYNLLSYIDVK